METLSDDYMENVRRLDEILGVGRSCDLVNRNYIIGGRRARLWAVSYTHLTLPTNSLV